MSHQRNLSKETLQNARAWFESLGYHADISFGTLYLELDCFTVELSQAEIENRAESWEDNQNQKD